MNTANERTRSTGGAQRPELGWALVPIITLIVLLALAYFLFGDEAAKGPNQIALTMAAIVAILVGFRHRVSMDEMRAAALESVGTGLPALFILLAVGALIGTWAMSGTLVAMVYWGLQLLSPNYFYFTVVLICAAVALCIGSSWTVAGTIGIGLMGVALQMGLSPAVTAGAVLSGAYFGDKSSPLSDATNLASAAAGAELYRHILETLWTSVPTLLLSLGFFFMLGSPGDFDASSLTEMLAADFDTGFVPFIPLIVVLGLALLKLSPFLTIMGGAIAGALVAVTLNPGNVILAANDPDLAYPLALLKGVWKAMASGNVSQTGAAALDQLLSRGGMESMLITIWLILSALAFGGIIEKVGILDRLLEPVLRAARTTGRLIASVVAASLGANLLVGDQYIAIVMPGKMFQSAFRAKRLAPEVLSRAVGDSATVISALVPWNSCGAYMAATLGVATVNYLPFAAFNLLNPIITMVFGFMGWRMIRTPEPRTA
ncbi:Na+/H+ antiporter NhaC family protein [Sedimentitalea sp. JM2-8]|uniref:Na+/H+ antiporter NhaC family protein n=1 Tax=Sedimentitalea xiamensis TaxID=3050037 RepID=A0ABT7FHQ2_9RHOB|nr:Na+/H+ antiporter NhaC family protein [Sedimentitalea xiamensis]MDK3074671.1 Na+/H+ antiporter NhaC family protein [Sedimentitalea xiamensis]